MMLALSSIFIKARTDHGAGINTCWGEGNCLPPDAARCGDGFENCNACDMGAGENCWGHEASFVGGERYCYSKIEPGTHRIPSDVCSDESSWDDHRIIQCISEGETLTLTLTL